MGDGGSVRVVHVAFMFASYKSDIDYGFELLDALTDGLTTWTGRPPPEPDLGQVFSNSVKCAFGWIATASSDPDTDFRLSGRYFDDAQGHLVSGEAISRISCTGTDSCGLSGTVYGILSGGAKFNMYVLGSSTISVDDDVHTYARSGGVNWKDGKWRRFPGPP